MEPETFDALEERLIETSQARLEAGEITLEVHDATVIEIHERMARMRAGGPFA